MPADSRITSGWCRQCKHLATRTGEPWDNQYRCAQGCRCTMQGCCPGDSARVHVPAGNGAPA